MKINLRYCAIITGAAVAALAVAFGVTVGTAPDQTPAASAMLVTPRVPRCEVEDRSGCLWLADQSGNGEGASFVALEDGTVRYLAPQGWKPIGAELAHTLMASGEAADRATRDWLACLEHIDDTTTIICPDGHVETS